MDLILFDLPDQYSPVLVAVLVGVLVLVLIWGMVLPWIRSRGNKGVRKKLDPIKNMGQVNYVIALRSAGGMDDLTWEEIFPLIEAFLEKSNHPRMEHLVGKMDEFGKGFISPTGSENRTVLKRSLKGPGTRSRDGDG